MKEEKTAIRQRILAQRSQMDEMEKATWDALISAKIFYKCLALKAKVVHCYLPMGDEIDLNCMIEDLLEAGVTIVTPKTLKNRKLEHLILRKIWEVEDGAFGTKHPKNGKIYTGAYDAIIVPGLAFDKEGYRIGYGGGYYDAFLSEQKTGHFIAGAYPFQQLETVPKEAHDRAVHEVVLPVL